MENVFELVGVQKMDFTTNDGQSIKGTKIYFSTEPTVNQKQNGFVGKVCDKHFFSAGSNIPSQIRCGEHYEFLFSFTGGKPKVSGFRPVNK